MLEIKRLDAQRVAMRGRLDASQAALADRELGRITEAVVLDLSGLDYISSAGLGVLVKLQVRLREANHSLRLADAQPRVRAVFHFANLEEFFGLV